MVQLEFDFKPKTEEERVQEFIVKQMRKIFKNKFGEKKTPEQTLTIQKELNIALNKVFSNLTQSYKVLEIS